ncbi:E3 ubiquitin-protein ligase ZSWIM2 [Echeneis naucrates]|uniref:E3 ubiquitin-protein ligase ZSWIM2 n=1 Tax=Echeneis naucrates TaxID=173247 RepID=UPI00111333A4|nr:E3 ubiquitin-protein ligase ZSWIM2 [Echeneis naucrates]
MFRKTPWRNTVSDRVTFHQDQALNTTILLLKSFGPTGFLLREEGGGNFKVCLGDPHTCSCPVFTKEKEPCKHICWVLLQKFKLPRGHEYSFQHGLVERQISEVLRGLHQTKAKRIENDPSASSGTLSQPVTSQEAGSVCRKVIQAQDVCPICQEELLEKKQPVCYCRFGCGNNVHISCMKVWSDHQKLSDRDGAVKCPLCREDFSSFKLLQEQMRNAAKLFTAAEREKPDRHLGVLCSRCHVCPITGKCFKCIVCSYFYLCEGCSKKGSHPQHQFASRTRVRSGSVLLDEGQQCRMCLQNFTLGERVRTLPCDHKLHMDCVDRILRKLNCCPLDGYVIYNPLTWRTSERNTSHRLASCLSSDFAKAEQSLKDLYVPGVALRDRNAETAPSHGSLNLEVRADQNQDTELPWASLPGERHCSPKGQAQCLHKTLQS